MGKNKEVAKARERQAAEVVEAYRKEVSDTEFHQ